MGGLGPGLVDAGLETHEGDAPLVRLAQATPAAFEPLYLRYRDRVLGYCYRRLCDRDEAEDAASAIFIAALRGLRGFRQDGGAGSFRAWLFTIAHNEIAMRHRSRARHAAGPLTAAMDIPDPARSPEDHVIASDGHRRLASYLLTLPPRERETIELRLADLSTSEIARVLGISEQGVRTAQARGVAKLRAVMSPPSASGREAVDA